MFLKLLFVTFEFINKVLAQIIQVAELSWSDIIYPKTGYSHQNAENLYLWHGKWFQFILHINDIPEYLGWISRSP